VDIAPTILDLLKIDIPSWMEGESIKNSMENKTMIGKPKFSMQLDGNKIYGPFKKGAVAVIKDKYKYLYDLGSRKSELYDLAKDHKELINIVAYEKERSEAMKSLILHRISIQ
jgi:arylsulfatase A-like enzyme